MRDSGEYIRIANKYIADVLSGKVEACRYVKQACERQKRDLAKSRKKGSEFPYKFDPEKAERVCQFVELLPHVEGEWASAGMLLTLEPWQIFIYTTVFGWVNRKTGKRRFRKVYIEVPRKNGKSAMSSPVALYMASADGEMGAQVYSAATKKDQAKIVFDTAMKMVLRTPSIREDLNVEATKYAIFQTDTGSRFTALSKDMQGSHDGLNIHCAIVDELHAHKTSETWDVLVTGIGARSQPLIWAITTAGFNRYGICYEERGYLTRVLSGQVTDERVFGIIYTLDKEDDWRDPKSWRKANPNWGVSVNPEQIESEAAKAIQVARSQNNFLTKHLNVWCNADTAWMNMAKWDECQDDAMDEAEFYGQPCIVAADLASKNDFASVCKLFVKKIDGKDHFYAFVRHYLNEDAAERSSVESLREWVDDGWVTLSDGNVTDFNAIQEDILDDCRNFKVTDACFDPFQAAQMQQNLAAAKVNCVEYTNSARNMSEPTKELEALVLDGRFHHNGDPVLAWMVSNVVAHTDSSDVIKPKRDKTLPHNKIDGAIATIMAIGRHLQAKPRQKEFQVFVFKRGGK